MRPKLAVIVGTRPNLVKAAPLLRELAHFQNQFRTILVHTGQHYDFSLFWQLIEDLDMTTPDIILDAESGSPAEQTARLMFRLEKVFRKELPDMVVVFGDVNSTLAAALVASQLHIRIAHVESGLRSFDLTMPEEVNRIVTDRLSDLLFVTEPSGLANLALEGISTDRIFYTGNIMIDSLTHAMSKKRNSSILSKLGIVPKNYALLTLHRPSNVDYPEALRSIIKAIEQANPELPIIFPCHPRTQKQLSKLDSETIRASGMFRLLEPMGYSDFLNLQMDSMFVLTDSGGVQEETTYLQIPCLTLRDNTERPVTVEIGSNTLVGQDPERIGMAVNAILNGRHKVGNIPKLWDGLTAERIVTILREVI